MAPAPATRFLDLDFGGVLSCYVFRVTKLFSLHHPLLVYSVSLTKHPNTLANLNCTSLWYSSDCCCYLPSHGPLPSIGSHQCFLAGISESTQWQERIHPTTWNRCSSRMSSRCWMLGLLQIEPGFPTKEKKKKRGKPYLTTQENWKNHYQ